MISYLKRWRVNPGDHLQYIPNICSSEYVFRIGILHDVDDAV